MKDIGQTLQVSEVKPNIYLIFFGTIVPIKWVPSFVKAPDT